ncbi:MAG: hypothetical protein HC792_01380 [Acaryochloridaceae cyanobacterium CSU_5_19]|nr:hypothetical protein [Acaryochloridaceae cyanobacterium CSU_5_19]
MNQQKRYTQCLQASLLGVMAGTGMTFGAAQAMAAEQPPQPLAQIVTNGPIPSTPEPSIAQPNTAEQSGILPENQSSSSESWVAPLPTPLLPEYPETPAALSAPQPPTAAEVVASPRANRPELSAPTDASTAAETLLSPEASEPSSVTKNLPESSAGIAIVSPVTGSVLNKPAATVVVEYGINQQVELRVNGKRVDDASIGRTETNTQTQRIQQTWYGVILGPGTNTLAVHQAGKAEPAAAITLKVPGQPERIKVQTLESLVPSRWSLFGNGAGTVARSRG